MEVKKITIELDEKILMQLELACSSGQTPELLAAELIKSGLSDLQNLRKSEKLADVALLKNVDSSPLFKSALGNANMVSHPSPVLSFLASPLRQSPGVVYPASIIGLSRERLQRKKEIEAEMKELSLLIETSNEADKEKYAMQYALLATELGAIV